MIDHKSTIRYTRRNSIRLEGYDYSQPGGYFITICTYRFSNYFGDLVNNSMVLGRCGKIVKDEWFRINSYRFFAEVYDDEFIVMPNHVHGIIWIVDVGATDSVAQQKSPSIKPCSLGTIVGQFKSRTTKRIRKNMKSPDFKIWQRGYYDHIIRNEKDLHFIRQYIQTNPHNR